MNQIIKNIKITDLHLWSENPRDPIDTNATDLDIIKKAIDQNHNKWNLPKLTQEMGRDYDLSELPTVVKKDNKYIVYDGNRRIAIIKYAQNPSWSKEIKSALFPNGVPIAFKNMKEIPCNVCTEETALNNIERKHINSGTWEILERSYFLHKHRGKEKDNFLIIEESTGIISKNPKMNQRFVKDEIFTTKNLNEIGFGFVDEKLKSNYVDNTDEDILNKIIKLVENKTISTRGPNRNKLIGPLIDSYSEMKDTLRNFDEKKGCKVVSKINNETTTDKHTRHSKRTKPQVSALFGGKLTLKQGDVNDLYRDICDLYAYYTKNKEKLSKNFPSLIRISLRLLVETAAEEKNIQEYVTNNFTNAKGKLNQDEKTTLSTQRILLENIVELLHIGAHNYQASKNLEQTLAMSLIIGKMLEITHST